MTLGFLWLMLALKIPLIALILVVWWAIKNRPEDPPASEGGGATHTRRSLPRDSPGAGRMAARHRRPPLECARSARGRGRSSTEPLRGGGAQALIGNPLAAAAVATLGP